MDIDTLRTFLELVKHRHFGKTAETLCVTQSAVSTRIRQIEQILGVQLFLREPRNIQLTDAARKLIPYAETIVTTWERATQQVVDTEGDIFTVSLGSVGSFWDSVMQHWFNEFVASTTTTRFLVELESNKTLSDKIIARTLDVAFLYDPPEVAPVKIVKIHDLALRLYTTYDKHLTLTEILNKRYILVDWGNRFLSEHHRLLNETVSPVAKVGQGRIALNTMLHTEGSAYLPEPLATSHELNGRCRLVEDAPVFRREAFAIYRDDNVDREVIEQVVCRLRAYLEKP